ncbi:Adenosine 5'-monophosphoramidase [Mortierella sp. AM989]|nr:Adenosine 5'-monophosphoramidase [Mortierella sp. AM989]
MATNPACIFCRIVKREIPSKILFETEHSLAFLDVGPLSEGHTLVIPKNHAQFMHELPDAELADLLPTAKKVAQAIGCKNYNVLQNNGRLAHQAVDHVHFHVIPKPNDNEGLVMQWNPIDVSADKMDALRKAYLKL